MRTSVPPLFLAVGLFLLWAHVSTVVAAERISSEALLPIDEEMLHCNFVNAAPADGALAQVNPPRFRWFYVPNPSTFTSAARVLYRFRFQIAAEPTFAEPVVDVQTDLNFYNELAPLPEGTTYYWRVGYMCQMASWDGQKVSVPRETTPSTWSAVRSFRIGPGTDVWDRSVLRDVHLGDHPRMTFRKNQIQRLRRLIETDPVAKGAFERNILADAERIMADPHWQNWPDTDERGVLGRQYYRAGKDLARAAFAYVVTGDPKYRNVVDIFAKIATFPRGGASSPEGMGGDSNEDSTSFTEFLALAYDWLYDEMTPEQRRACEESLNWRIDAWMNEYQWSGTFYKHFQADGYDGPAVRARSLMITGGGHSWEGSMDTLPAAIAIYHKSPIARKYFHTVVNYLIAVGERYAQLGVPELGLSYGHSHLKWWLYQTYYLSSALPELHLEKNPLYRKVADYFLHVAPVGMPYAPWGRYDPDGAFWGHRHETFRLLALLLDDGVLLENWNRAGGEASFAWRPWVQIAAPLAFPDPPTPRTGTRTHFFNRAAGWAIAHTYPPTDPRAFAEGVGVIFPCRPNVGSHGSCFYSNASLQLYGYGQCLNYGGGPGGTDPQPFHTMAHDTVLIDGLGQAYGGPGAYKIPLRGAILAYEEGQDYTYWVGDATWWYPHEPYEVGSWVIRFDTNVYGKLAVPYLRMFRRHVLFMHNKYVVLFDDLETDADHPARFSWLWHVKQPGPVEYAEDAARLVYHAGPVKVILRHVAHPQQLEYLYAPGLEGLKNPITGEDFTREQHTVREINRPGAEERFPAQHFWFTNRQAASRFQFLTVIYPVNPDGGEEPAITRLDDLSVKVEADGLTDIISFDPETKLPVTHVVDLPAFRRPIEIDEPAGASTQAVE